MITPTEIHVNVVVSGPGVSEEAVLDAFIIAAEARGWSMGGGARDVTADVDSDDE
jgi:hypothetical protein